jgi:hypothetical protein
MQTMFIEYLCFWLILKLPCVLYMQESRIHEAILLVVMFLHFSKVIKRP